MPGYSQIVGHEETIAHLKNTVSSGMIGHAYLFDGAPGIGKMMLAEAFAKTLTCEEDGAEACGKCHSCHQAEKRCHPDIVYVTHEKPGVISVEDIRTQLVGDAFVRPYYGRRKVYIMDHAELMNNQAQNALLKTLEEPPSYAVFLLLTSNSASLLDTIRSRCLELKMHPVKDDVIQNYLMTSEHLPDYQARFCAAFAQGSIGKALELAHSEDFDRIRQTALNLVKKAKSMEMPQILATVHDASAFKLSIRDFLDILMIYFRDVLYFKATQDADRLIFRDELGAIRQNARTSSYEGLEEILHAIGRAGQRLDANVSFDLTMELLFLTIKEN